MALGSATGAALLAVTVTGDALFLGVVLGVAALDAVAGATAVLAGIGVLGRWGSTSLAALAGGQAVLGPAGWTGPATAVLSSWAAAAALVLVAPRERVPAAAFGLFAAAVVAGPAVTDVSDVGALALRVVASVVVRRRRLALRPIRPETGRALRRPDPRRGRRGPRLHQLMEADEVLLLVALSAPLAATLVAVAQGPRGPITGRQVLRAGCVVGAVAWATLAARAAVVSAGGFHAGPLLAAAGCGAALLVAADAGPSTRRLLLCGGLGLSALVAGLAAGERASQAGPVLAGLAVAAVCAFAGRERPHGAGSIGSERSRRSGSGGSAGHRSRRGAVLNAAAAGAGIATLGLGFLLAHDVTGRWALAPGGAGLLSTGAATAFLAGAALLAFAGARAAPSERGAEARAAPSERGAEARAAPSERGAEARAAPSERGAEARAAPSERGAEARAAPSERGAEARAAPSERGAEARAAPSERGAEARAAPSTRSAGLLLVGGLTVGLLAAPLRVPSAAVFALAPSDSLVAAAVVLGALAVAAAWSERAPLAFALLALSVAAGPVALTGPARLLAAAAVLSLAIARRPAWLLAVPGGVALGDHRRRREQRHRRGADAVRRSGGCCTRSAPRVRAGNRRARAEATPGSSRSKGRGRRRWRPGSCRMRQRCPQRSPAHGCSWLPVRGRGRGPWGSRPTTSVPPAPSPPASSQSVALALGAQRSPAGPAAPSGAGQPSAARSQARPVPSARPSGDGTNPPAAAGKRRPPPQAPPRRPRHPRSRRRDPAGRLRRGGGQPGQPGRPPGPQGARAAVGPCSGLPGGPGAERPPRSRGPAGSPW